MNRDTTKRGMEAEPEHVAMFLVEGASRRALNHPHVVQSNDAGVTDDRRLYLVMEAHRGTVPPAPLDAYRRHRGAPLPLPIHLRPYSTAAGPLGDMLVT
jgi:hypothetical protein